MDVYKMKTDVNGRKFGLPSIEENWITLVCLDRYDRSVPEGRLYHPVQPEGSRFYGMIDFFKKADALLDSAQLPQRFSEPRTFANGQAEPQKWETPAPALPRRGHLATFSLRVRFRRNSSWQGTLGWLEGKREEQFRSALELIRLMDSALLGSQVKPARAETSDRVV